MKSPDSSDSLKPITDVKIMIVDDDPDICELLTLLLSDDGRQIETYTEPQRALEALKGGNHHVLVLDLMMPGLDGMNLLMQLRQFDPDVGVIIHTANPSLESATKALKLGADSYLYKPSTPEEFDEAIGKILSVRGMLADPVKNVLSGLGANIRKHRHAQGLTLKQVATNAGITSGALSMIERAQKSPSLVSLLRIARALGVPINELIDA